MISLTDVDREFLECVKLLVPYVVSEEKLIAKQMNCKDVEGKDMLVHIEVRFVIYVIINKVNMGIQIALALFDLSLFRKMYILINFIFSLTFYNYPLCILFARLYINSKYLYSSKCTFPVLI